jgi:hypothetical protein
MELSEPPTLDTSVLVKQYLSAAAEREAEHLPTAEVGETFTEGPLSRCGAEPGRSMGALVANRQGRFGVQGPSENADPHLARVAGVRERSELEVIGSRVADSVQAVIAPWGREDALGTDPISVGGKAMGEEIRTAFGMGGLALGGRCGQACGGGGGTAVVVRRRDPASGAVLAMGVIGQQEANR